MGAASPSYKATGDREPLSLWFSGAGACELRAEALPAMGENEVLVRTLFSGISRGTEKLVFDGKVPESEFERMRGPHMGGRFPFPVKYGYSAVGVVDDGPAALKGRLVFCLHPHQSTFVTHADMVHLLPDALPPERAVLAANMETALNICWDAGVMPGDRVAVFGAGVVGSLVAFIASRIPGAEVTLVDRNSGRQSLAEALGVPFSSGADLVGEFDVLINASASAEALDQAISLAGFEARIVEASWYGENPVQLNLGGAFHARRLSIVSSQVGAVSAAQRPRWDFARRLTKALQLLGDDHLDALISGETPFEEIAEAYPGIIGDPQTLCHRIRY
ncbi:zinc-binding alcohol dehydrogenase [Rhizobium sp. L1K21]|uniref:zinc-dependent alcohol dehydrogenase n=1 Tax=Rhizobium sp. L1K21 TaxID=2954933 RepID=UPI00209366B3|nr:zinc-binding alcohol dehydrogenase [Rhizobium sp. L1K21]MCO6184626.1 zinc-binding alcohol dehydrogenase [Rhizobium sp. L1K21]